MRCQLLHRERGLADSAGKTVGMFLRAACRASFVGIRCPQNHAAQQVGHGAALAVAAAVTQDPGRIRFRAAPRYGMAVARTAEGTGKSHHRAGQYGGDQYI